MVKRTETTEHHVRIHMLGVITEVGNAKVAVSEPRVGAADRKWLEEKLQRLQAIAHEILARVEQMETRADAH